MRHVVDISDPSAVAEARRLARGLADATGLAAHRAEALAIVVTEMATNLLRHARSGQLLLQVQPGAGPRVAVAAIDAGPGIPDIDLALSDGYSTGASAGGGLGAMRRLADSFDIRSTPERGTVTVCGFGAVPVLAGVEIGGFLMNYPGDRACGDGFVAREVGGRVDLFAVDGLGHGPRAETAAGEAIAGLGALRGDNPAQVLSELSARLAGSRGSVAALAQIEAADGRLRLAGIGNIAALLVQPGGQVRRLISREGRLGGAVRMPPVETATMRPGDVLILHSDGLSTLRSHAELPPLAGMNCEMIAAQLMRDRNKGRDDCCALVARLAGEDEA
ncbi:SpoIIE family protein phosphatase [Limimaricola sp.]|uniref:SpoIIE family protein phosphatase n=1 Tax=Limimaricola sp. TaxID=2211665 RepID=UPI00405824E4